MSRWKFNVHLAIFATIFAIFALIELSTLVHAEETAVVTSNEDEEAGQNLDEAATELGENDENDVEEDVDEDEDMTRKRRAVDDDSDGLQLCLLPSGQLTIVRDSRSAMSVESTSADENNNYSNNLQITSGDGNKSEKEVVKRAKFLEGGFKKRAKFLEGGFRKRAKFLEGGFKRAKFLEGGFRKRAKFLEGGFKKRAKFLEGGFKKRAKFLEGGFKKRAKFLEGGFKKRAKYFDDTALMFQRTGSAERLSKSGPQKTLTLRAGIIMPYQLRLHAHVLPSTSAKRHSADGPAISMISNNGRFVKCIKLKQGKQNN